VVIDWGTATFEGVELSALQSLLADGGDDLEEATIVDSKLQSAAETLQRCRGLMSGDPGLWEQLEDAYAILEAEHAESPTTERVGKALDTSTPPAASKVQELLEQANDPRPPRADDDTWGQLEDCNEDLIDVLPEADLTAEVQSMIAAGPDEYAENEVEETLLAATELLDRWEAIQRELDELDAGTIVRIGR